MFRGLPYIKTAATILGAVGFYSPAATNTENTVIHIPKIWKILRRFAGPFHQA